MKTAVSTVLWSGLVLLLLSSGSQALGESSDARIPLKMGGKLFELSGPYSFENLTLYPMHKRGAVKTGAILTLQEALRDGVVVLYESGNVRKLFIENFSEVQVFIQAGDVVKGGRQDRVLTVDMIIPPKSGRVALPSFCVERGRWSRRGKESADRFSVSDQTAVGNALTIAVRYEKNQGRVWEFVGKLREKLKRKVGLRKTASESSLQLALEDENLRKVCTRYYKTLGNLARLNEDIVGFAYAVNGRVLGADAYRSRSLFLKLWPKLLRSVVIEAIAEHEIGLEFEPPSKDAVRAFLLEADQGRSKVEKINERNSQVMKETKKALVFESHGGAGEEEARTSVRAK
ncbi:MAG: ARPP-1 family domain-containing protein [Planctomycetota bacterium]|jgi:hypothetical protein